jgi:hypothetical protein
MADAPAAGCRGARQGGTPDLKPAEARRRMLHVAPRHAHHRRAEICREDKGLVSFCVVCRFIGSERRNALPAFPPG